MLLVDWEQLFSSVMFTEYKPGPRFSIFCCVLINPFGPVQLKIYSPTPPETSKSIVPSLAPKHEILYPLNSETIAIESLFDADISSGSVISISRETSHKFSSYATTIHVPAHKLSTSSS